MNQDNLISISSLTDVADDQLITIKGHIAHLNAMKKIVSPLRQNKRASINDHYGHIKTVLLGKHTDKQIALKAYTRLPF